MRKMSIKTKKPGKSDKWELRLYVAGHTQKCKSAFASPRSLCEKCLPGKCNIKVIDLLKNPQLARDDEIIAIPTLVRRFPLPVRKNIGNLANEDRVIKGLDMPC